MGETKEPSNACLDSIGGTKEPSHIPSCYKSPAIWDVSSGTDPAQQQNIPSASFFGELKEPWDQLFPRFLWTKKKLRGISCFHGASLLGAKDHNETFEMHVWISLGNQRNLRMHLWISLGNQRNRRMHVWIPSRPRITPELKCSNGTRYCLPRPRNEAQWKPPFRRGGRTVAAC